MNLRCLTLLVTALSPMVSAETISLSNRQLITTDLKEAKLISELNGYAIVAGRHCLDCDENLAIYLYRTGRADEGVSADKIRTDTERYTYPGRYLDYMSKKLVEKTRMFYGHCYEGQPSLLWLTEYSNGDRWVKSEYLILIADEGLKHRYIEHQQPSVFYIENPECIELEGFMMELEP
ncbi:hypothetical protein MO867_02445 [Microbulbifer sp. OS29]|uniref:Uncharacterized protein n=1 Tax=Microbulbifer okhotskensis TaxID=2926617 RepID=A0A9X2EKC9_9GAMM|nr:hypothetical protein [Microbulbifer okhotskensis]MCO1333190.1 hypothetical protein [Microbulbifer okhotskensis]